MIAIRREEPSDHDAVYRLNVAAFNGVAEARVVDGLASGYRLRSQWDGIPDAAFMAVVFDDAVLPEAGGIARYRDEFDAAM